MRIGGIEVTTKSVEGVTPYHVARGLGRMVRFGGHTEEPNTVLQHVLAGAIYAASKWNDNGRLALLFLMHDAPEAICGEIPFGFKTDEQRHQEDSLYFLLAKEWGIPDMDEEENEALKWLDSAIGCDEAHAYKLEGYDKPDSGDMMLQRIVRSVKDQIPWRHTATSRDLWAIYHEIIKLKDTRLLDLIGVK